MNEWGVVLVIIALVGLIATFVKMTNSYSTTITKLTVTLDNLQRCVEELEAAKEKTNKRIYGLLDGHTERLTDHEYRIKTLEEMEEKK